MMKGYLIAEEGPLAGLLISLEEGDSWIIGRDPEASTIVLEDPSVSRKHVVCRLTPEGFFIENLSAVNPATQNGKTLTQPTLLQEGDILQIGSNYFRFSHTKPDIPTSLETPSDLPAIHFDIPDAGRWIIKVISGPNAGAEFSLLPSSTYTMGRDPQVCDIVFHDLSVSRKHAKLSIDSEEKAQIEDLQTRNGTLVNGSLLAEPQALSSQDLIAMGTTSFLIIDRKQIHETIISPTAHIPLSPSPLSETATSEPLPPPLQEKAKHWKDTIIPTRYLLSASIFCLLLLVIITSTFSLFRTESVAIPEKKEEHIVQEALASFTGVQFSFDDATGKLFLVGHVLTTVDKQELTYKLSTMPFLSSIEDTVIIDELVWQNMNALLLSYPEWQAITIYSPSAGKFVLKGYVQTIEQAEALSDYMNTYFPYPNLLDNQVVVGNNLSLRIQGLLLEEGFAMVTFNLAGGELVLSGRIDGGRSQDFSRLTSQFSLLPGIRAVQNYVIAATGDATRIDLSSQYVVSGVSLGSHKEQFVIINKKMFATGDYLNGMKITEIQPEVIFLEKDGIKFKIHYNLQ